MNTVKKTPLYDNHIALKAKMVEFAGWQMPIQYGSIIEEHQTVRQKAGIFDVSHMGEVFVSGPQSLEFLQTLFPRDLSKLTDGKAVYTQFTNEQGGIIDDLIVYKLKEKSYLLIVNASRIEQDYAWMKKNLKKFDAAIENKSDEYSMIAVQGPAAISIIEKAGIPTEKHPKRFSISSDSLYGMELLLSRTGYTGEDGFEIIVKNDKAAQLWEKLIEEGMPFGLKPIGLGARDTLRLESAMMLYGNDLDETTSPIEASLVWSIDKDKTENYIGKDIILNHLNGTSRKLIGFKMIERAIPRHDYEIYKDNEKIGKVTSGGVGPAIEANVGLGYINTNSGLTTGDTIQIKVRDRFCNAEIVKTPFYKAGSSK